MAKCCCSGENFIHFVFSPCIAVFSSQDVSEICRSANLTFCELLKPFSQLTKDVALRDNSNLVHTITNLRLRFLDPGSPPAPIHVSRSHLDDAVSSCSIDSPPSTMTVANGNLSACIPASTPWFEAWRYVFIRSLKPKTHEFLNHCLAAMFVVSTNHPDPIGSLTTLKQHHQQQLSDMNTYPCWFNSNVAKFYVLLHCPSKNPKFSAEEVYANMERTFGTGSCYLLTLFTESQQTSIKPFANGNVHTVPTGPTPDASFPETQTDPWLSHLLPHGYRCNGVMPTSVTNVPSDATTTDPLLSNVADNDHEKMHEENANAVRDTLREWPLIPKRLLEPHGRGLSQTDLEHIRKFVHDFVNCCLLPWVEQTSRVLNEQIAHRMKLSRSFLSATKKFFSTAVGAAASNSSVAPSLHTTNSAANLTHSNLVGKSGAVGTTALPVVHSDTTLPHVTSKEDVTQAQVVYATDSAEMQMRRLADLAFLFQQYEVAHQMYNVLRRDFQNDAASVYSAGAHEMSALSIFMQGSTSQRQYPYHYIDSAVTDYLKSKRNVELALRATLLNAEALHSRGLFSEMTQCLLRLVSEDDDLTSALLLEQSAHCVLRLKRPQLRKFAFRMALAAFRYQRAKQFHLSIRCYNLAYPLFSDRFWTVIEDYVNFNLGKQYWIIGDLHAASQSLRRCLLNPQSQSAEQQSTFVQDYLVSLKALLSDHRSRGQPTCLPEFPLPIVSIDQLKVMLGRPTSPSNNLPIEARGVQFADDDDRDPPASFYTPQKPLSVEDESLKTDTWFLWWMEGTDISDLSDEEDPPEKSSPWDVGPTDSQRAARDFSLTNTRIARCLEWVLQQGELSERKRSSPAPFSVLHWKQGPKSRHKPLAPVGESITCQLPLSNPTSIPLVFTNLNLLWSFVPQSSPHPPVSNDADSNETNPARYSLVSTAQVSELVMLAGESKLFEISLKTKQPGQLSITGLCFEWNHVIKNPHASIPNKINGPNNHGVTFSADMTSTEQIDQFSDPLSNDDGLNDVVDEKWNDSVYPIKEVVRGKVVLEPQPGPLTWTVTSGAPLLEVFFSDLPTRLFQGQLCHLQVSLSNTGTEALNRIRLLSNWPGALHFCSNELTTNLCQTEHQSKSQRIADDHPILPWLDVPFARPYQQAPNHRAVLNPGSSANVTMWLRAPHLTHPHLRRRPSDRRMPASIPYPYLTPGTIVSSVQTRTIHMVFQYTSSNPNPQYPVLNSRFVRHHFELELHPSLRLEAVAHRSPQTGVQNLLIALQVRNESPKPTKFIFELTQIACVSRFWTIAPLLSVDPTQGSPCAISPGDTVTLYFLALPVCGDAQSPEFSLSSIPLGLQSSDAQAVLTADSPSLEFYRRSGLKWKSRQKCRSGGNINKSVQDLLDITLIALWKVKADVTSEGTESWVSGQSHVTLQSLGRRAIVPLLEQQIAECSKPAPPLPFGHIHRSHLVQFRLHHPHRVEYTPSRARSGKSFMHRSPLAYQAPAPSSDLSVVGPQISKRLIFLSVNAELYNSSPFPVTVMLDSTIGECNDTSDHGEASDDIARQITFSSVSSPSDLSRRVPHLMWVGLVGRSIQLQPFESKTIPLKACVIHPGYYSTGNLTVKASFGPAPLEEASFSPQLINPTFILISPINDSPSCTV